MLECAESVSIGSTALIILLVRAYGGLGCTECPEGEIEMRRTVLLVEDEAKLADVLAEQLAEEDFDVRQARSLRQALRMLDDLVPDVAVIDIGLPDGSGLDVLRRLRCGADRLDSGTPGARADRRGRRRPTSCAAFERGADDYLRKPFALPELIARVHALLARGRRVHADIRVGDLLLEPSARRATWAGCELPLSGREYDLLLELARDPGAVRSKADLLREVWRMPATLRTRTVDSHASRLRRKLVAAGAPTDPIVNEWGRGYRLEVARALSRRPPRYVPLEARLSIAVALVVALALAAIGLFVVARVHDRVAREGRTSLMRTLDAASPALQQGRVPRIPGTRLAWLEAGAAGGDAALVAAARSGRASALGTIAERNVGGRRVLAASRAPQHVERDLLLIEAEGLAPIGLVLVLVGVRLFERAGRRHRQHLETIMLAAQQIGDGDRDVALVSGRSEVGRVAGSLEALATGLRDLDRERGLYVSQVSHDLRNPLAVIGAYASVLRRGERSRPRAAKLRTIEDEVSRLAGHGR